jgi:hypothetical protein
MLELVCYELMFQCSCPFSNLSLTYPFCVIRAHIECRAGMYRTPASS